MRRILLLALVVAIAAARHSYFDEYDSSDSITENIFRPGVEYKYRYESQVLTGIRTTSNQLSGVKIHCTVRVQNHRDGTTVVKMQHIQVLKVNDVVDRLEDDRMLSDEQCTRLTGEQGDEMTEQLSKPIKCRFEEGEVRDVKSVSSDKYWSINIKKGLLSMLQLKLTGKSSFSSDSDSFSDSYRPRNRFHDIVSSSSRRMSSRTKKTFKVIESDVNGDCETKYFINSDRSSDYSSVSDMKVTKVKDFSHCLTKNSFEQGVFAGLPHYSSERKLVQPSMTADYELSGDRHHYLIKKVSLQAKYLFRPYGQEGGQISTQINQKLQLKSTEEIQNPLSADNFVSEKHGLKMEIPHSNYDSETSRRQGDSSNKEQEYKETIDRKLSQLLSSIYPVMHESAAAQLMQINLIVRHVPHRDLYNIIKSYQRHESSESKKKCEILLDLLPTIQSPDVAKVLIELIRDGSVSGIRARVSLGAMSLTVRPSPDVVKSLMSLYKEGTNLDSEPLIDIRQGILLSVGTICNKMINTMRRTNKPISEFMSTVEQVSEELTSMLEQSNSECDTIRILKSMGNMGSRELIQTIKSVIENTNQPRTVREQGIFALRKLAKPFAKQVHPILISCVLNKKESTSIRLSAFVELKKSHPSYTTLQLIGSSLRSESSSQVKTFIYSSLISLATTNSHISERQESHKNARKVLKLMRSVPVGPTDSKQFSTRVYSDRLEAGAMLDSWSVKSESTGTPKSFVSSLYTTIFGNRLHLLEGGVDGTGHDTVMRRLVDPMWKLWKNRDSWKETSTWRELSWRDIKWQELLNPQSSGSRSGDKLRDFMSGKQFEPRTDDEIRGLLYGEVLGQEMFYTQANKDNIKRTIERVIAIAMVRSPELIRKLKEGIHVDELKTLTIVHNSLVVPTPMGIPLSLNISSSKVLKVEGHVRITSMPSFSDFITRRPFMTKNFEIEGRINPSCSAEAFGYMGVDMRWLRTGTAIKGNFVGQLPVKGKISVNPSDSKVTITYEPPQENIRLFKAKVEPTTFVYYIPKNIERLPFQRELRPMKNQDNSVIGSFQKQHHCHVSGFTWDLRAQWTKCHSHCCVCYPLTGKQEVELFIQPLDRDSNKEVVVKIKKFSQQMYNGGDSSDYFYSDPSSNYRLGSRDSSDYDEDFEQVENDESITTPRKAELQVEVEYKGYRTDKKVKSKVTWITENNYLKHQLNVQVVGKAGGDMSPFKVKATGWFRCPITVESLSHYVRSGEVLGKMEVSGGINGFNEYSVKGKVWESNKSQWNQELQSSGIEPDSDVDSDTDNSYGRYSNMCYGGELEFPHLNRVGKKYLTKTLDIAKLLLFRTGQKLQVGIPEHMPTNKIVVYGELKLKQSKLSVIVKSPRETDYLPNLSLSSPWSRLNRPSLLDQSPSSFYKNSTEFDLDTDFDRSDYDEYERHSDFYTPSYYGECKVHRGKMQTFDGTPLLLPVYDSDTTSSGCDVLLAQDCSDRGTFSVTGSFKRGRWAIKALVSDSIIELTPDSYTGQVTCKVNGDEKRVRQSMSYQVRDSSSSDEVVCTVEKTEDGIKLKMLEKGVTIKLTENNKISIWAAPWSMLQGRTCGLCGNYNYNPSDDMTSLSREQMYSSRRFVMDSMLPSTHCDSGDFERQLGSRHQGFCRKEKTIKMERTVGGVEETCFSTRPVTVCRKHCSSDSTSEHTVRFSCVPRDSQTADRLLNKYYSGHHSSLSEELTDLPSSTVKQIELPSQCSPNNN